MTPTDAVLRLQAHLTDRDRCLLDWLADHHVLTTPQIDHALFGSPRATQRRLLDLHHLGLINRFRPLRPGGGSYPWHHVLGHHGAELIAATRDQPPPRRAETLRRNRRTATSRTLNHLLGVNQFFTDLAGHARTHPDTTLERWWSETRCATPGAFAPGLITPIHPDGHGIWRHGERRVPFYLEHDTGSESLATAAAKLAGYNTHLARGGPHWPVLFWLPTPERETGLRALLRSVAGAARVATATRRGPSGRHSPAERRWRLLPPAAELLLLSELVSTNSPHRTGTEPT